jgi:hypothetical protein
MEKRSRVWPMSLRTTREATQAPSPSTALLSSMSRPGSAAAALSPVTIRTVARNAGPASFSSTRRNKMDAAHLDADWAVSFILSIPRSCIACGKRRLRLGGAPNSTAR